LLSFYLLHSSLLLIIRINKPLTAMTIHMEKKISTKRQSTNWMILTTVIKFCPMNWLRSWKTAKILLFILSCGPSPLVIHDARCWSHDLGHGGSRDKIYFIRN